MADPSELDETGSDAQFHVVVNHEEQYSLWPATRPPPAGWRSVAGPMSRERCLAHIEEVWTDMRPASLRRLLDARAEEPTGSGDAD